MYRSYCVVFLSVTLDVCRLQGKPRPVVHRRTNQRILAPTLAEVCWHRRPKAEVCWLLLQAGSLLLLPHQRLEDSQTLANFLGLDSPQPAPPTHSEALLPPQQQAAILSVHQQEAVIRLGEIHSEVHLMYSVGPPRVLPLLQTLLRLLAVS